MQGTGCSMCPTGNQTQFMLHASSKLSSWRLLSEEDEALTFFWHLLSGHELERSQALTNKSVLEVCMFSGFVDDRCEAQQPPTSPRGFYLGQNICCSQPDSWCCHMLWVTVPPSVWPRCLYPSSHRSTVTSSHPHSHGHHGAHYVFMPHSLLLFLPRISLFIPSRLFPPMRHPFNAPHSQAFCFKILITQNLLMHTPHCPSCQRYKLKSSYVEKWQSWSHFDEGHVSVQQEEEANAKNEV